MQYLKSAFPQFMPTDFAQLLSIYKVVWSPPETTGPLYDALGDCGPAASVRIRNRPPTNRLQHLRRDSLRPPLILAGQ